MEDISQILTEFLAKFRNEVLEYYILTNTYLKDLVAYKNVELKTKLHTVSEGIKNNSYEKILKAVKTGLNTLGVPIAKLNESQNNFVKFAIGRSSEFATYNSYVDLYQKNYTNKLLFEILLEYLLDIDSKKIQNLKLFDLLPKGFLEKLSEFKERNLSNPQIKEVLTLQNYTDYIDLTNLRIKKNIHIKQAGTVKELMKEKKAEKDILLLLQEAKENSIKTLETPKKEIIAPSKIGLKRDFASKEKLSHSVVSVQKLQTKTMNQETRTERVSPIRAPSVKRKQTLLDSFGNFHPLHQEIMNKFEIDKVSFLNSRVKNADYMDLENLFYYISNLRMLNIDNPFSTIEILEILKNFVNENIFSSSKDKIPDAKSIFYGLAIISQLKLIKSIAFINIEEIKKFINANLKNFLPEKLESNLFSLLSLRIITPESFTKSDNYILLDPIKNLDVTRLEKNKPIRDMFNHLALLALLNMENKISEIKIPYFNELKKLIASNGSINNLFTDSTKALLIIDLLELKELEPDICSALLNYLMKSTAFFNLTNLNKELNWRNHQLGYKIELKMLFWALFASSRYAPL